MNIEDVRQLLTLDRFNYNAYLRAQKIYNTIMNADISEFKSKEERDTLYAEYRKLIVPIHSERYEDVFTRYTSTYGIDVIEYLTSYRLPVVLYTKTIMTKLMELSNSVTSNGKMTVGSRYVERNLGVLVNRFITAVNNKDNKQWVYLRCLRIMLVGGLLRNTIFALNVQNVINFMKEINMKKRQVIYDTYDEDELYARITLDRLDLEDAFYDSRESLNQTYNEKMDNYLDRISDKENRDYYMALHDNLINSYGEFNPQLAKKTGVHDLYNEYLDLLALGLDCIEYLTYHDSEEFYEIYKIAKNYNNTFSVDVIRTELFEYERHLYLNHGLSKKTYLHDLDTLRDYGIMNVMELDMYYSEVEAEEEK